MKWVVTVMVMVVGLLHPFTGHCVTESALACAIDSWTNGARWFECGSPDGREDRAREYAKLILKSSARYGHDPLVLAGIIEQESGFDRCQIGRPSRRSAQLPLHPTREQVLQAFGSIQARRKARVTRVDAGPAQFLWPYGSAFSATEGVTLDKVLDLAWSLDTLGWTLDRHRELALKRGSVTHGFHRLPPDDTYWTRHNTGSGFSPRYYSNVTRRVRRLSAKTEDCERGFLTKSGG